MEQFIPLTREGTVIVGISLQFYAMVVMRYY